MSCESQGTRSNGGEGAGARQHERALAFYQRLGFQVLAEQVPYFERTAGLIPRF